MTIHVPYRGILEITGDHDVGKTIAALQTATPKDVVFVDDDVKGSGTVRQMVEAEIKFDDYIDLAPLRLALGKAPSPDQLIDNVVDPTIERILSKKRKVVVWDTWRIVYQSFRLHVERNQALYSKAIKWQGNSTIIQGLISRVARGLELQYLNKLKENSELLIITHHVKDWYESNVKVGTIPESSSTFSEVCNMRIWLRRNHRSKVPVILFLKRPNVPILGKNGRLKFVNIVPLKITPTEKHESIWDAIAEYEKNPIESREPTPDETPTPEELMEISGTLSPEMKKFVQVSIDFQLKLDKDTAEELSKGMQEAQKEEEEEKKVDNIPHNGVQLLALAKSRFGYDLQSIERILEMSFSEINSSFNRSYWEVLADTYKASTNEVKKKK